MFRINPRPRRRRPINPCKYRRRFQQRLNRGKRRAGEAPLQDRIDAGRRVSSGNHDEIVDVRRDALTGHAIDMERDRGASRRRRVAQLVNCPAPRAYK